MKNIEQEVRMALANDSAGRINDLYLNPGKNALIRRELETVLVDLVDGMVESGIITEKDAMRSRYDLIPAMNKEFTAEKLTQNVADSWMHDRQHYDRQIGLMRQVAEQEKVELPEEFTAAYNNLLESVCRKENIVNSLIERAEEQGLDLATSTASLHEAIRQEYGTKEEYIQATEEMVSDANDLVNGFASLLGSVNDPVLGELFPKVIKKTMELHVKYIVQADVEAIYAKK